MKRNKVINAVDGSKVRIQKLCSFPMVIAVILLFVLHQTVHDTIIPDILLIKQLRDCAFVASGRYSGKRRRSGGLG